MFTAYSEVWKVTTDCFACFQKWRTQLWTQNLNNKVVQEGHCQLGMPSMYAFVCVCVCVCMCVCVYVSVRACVHAHTYL